MARRPRESSAESMDSVNIDIFAMWNKTEKDLLVKEMVKHSSFAMVKASILNGI